MKVDGREYRTIWMDGSVVKTINQPLIPHRFEVVDLPDHRATAEAISNMTLRGAGAIGAAGAFGMAQVFLEAPAEEPARGEYVAAGYETLRDTRPTARDLFYCLDRVRAAGAAGGADAAVAEAQAIAEEYVQAGRAKWLRSGRKNAGAILGILPMVALWRPPPISCCEHNPYRRNSPPFFCAVHHRSHGNRSI